MIQTFRIQGDVAEIIGRKPTARAMKTGLIRGVVLLHKSYSPLHFQKGSRERYGGAYLELKKKKGNGAPLVESGSLRKRITAYKRLNDVKGTSKRAALHLKFGRPDQYSPQAMEKRIFVLMKEKRISYEKAQALAYRSAGYGARIRSIFERALSKTHPEEETAVAQEVQHIVIDEMNKPKPRPVRKVG